MSYLVFCTFDLKNATSSDYETAYAALEKLGLQKVHKSDKGKEVVSRPPPQWANSTVTTQARCAIS